LLNHVSIGSTHHPPTIHLQGANPQGQPYIERVGQYCQYPLRTSKIRYVALENPPYQIYLTIYYLALSTKSGWWFEPL